MQTVVDRKYPVLYRYMERKWAEDFVKGNIRVNTLYGYQIVEHAEIGDGWEGFRVFDLDPKRSTKDQIDVLIKNYPHLAGLRDHPEFMKDSAPGYPIQISEVVPDCYMLCFTSQFSAKVMQDFGVDTCIEIHQPEELFRSLSKALEKYALFGALSTCQYEDRGGSIEVQAKHRPQVLKPGSLKHQKEVRFVWDPLPGAKRDINAHNAFRPFNYFDPDSRLPVVPLEPIFINQSEVSKFCHILTDEEVSKLSAGG